MSLDDPNDAGPAGRPPYAEPPAPATGPAAPDDASSQRYPRAELRRKVSLKFKEFQGFVNEYSENVSAGGMFIRTTSPQPVGTVFDFEFTLGDDYTLIHGLGEVVWVRERDEGFDRPPGMGVRFLSLDPGSRKLIDRMVAERLARGRESGADDAVWWDDETAAPARTAAVGSEALSSIDAPAGEPSAATGAGGGYGPSGDAGEGSRPSVFDEPSRSRSSGPSPYIYTRSYGGSGFSSGGGGGRGRTVLIALLVVVSLVAAAAAFVLLAPDTVQRWLTGDDGEEGVTLVAREPGEEEDSPGDPVEPVAPGEARRLPPPPVERPEEESGVAGEEVGGTGEEGGEDLGFFPTAPDPDGGPEPDQERVTEPEIEPEPAPGDTPFTRILNVVWEERGRETLVTVHLDGAIEEWGYSHVRLASPPRELVRIDGVERPFARPTIPVGTDLVDRVRLGHHPEGRTSQMHVVIDLADPGARLDRSEAAGSELRLWITPGDA